MEVFEAGTLSVLGARALAGVFAAYAVLSAWFTYQGFRSGLADRWSAAVASTGVLGIAFMLWWRPLVMPAPFSLWLLVVALVALVLSLTLTLGRYQEHIDRFRQQFGARLTQILADRLPEERLGEWRRLQERFQMGKEGLRKTPHLLMGLVLLFYVGIGYAILRALAAAAAGAGTEVRTNMEAAAAGGWLAAGHLATAFSILALLLLITPNEILRLRFPELSYPFKTTILRAMRPREKGLFGAHYYILTGLGLALLWLGRDPLDWQRLAPAGMAVIAVAVFADAASALVGIRFGRRKLPHNRNKSHVGTVGGTVVAFVVALPLTGLTVALASALVFLLVDVFAPVPVAVSDNLLLPFLLAAAYTVLDPHLAPMFPLF